MMLVRLALAVTFAALLASCAPAADAPPPPTPIVPTATAIPIDLLLLDTLIDEHNTTIALAQQVSAWTPAPRAELTGVAADAFTNGQADLAQVQAWRRDWFPGELPTEGVPMNLPAVVISDDSNLPLDLRLLDALLEQLRSSLAVARLVEHRTTRDDLRVLATAAITTLSTQITQLEAWRLEWFNISG